MSRNKATVEEYMEGFRCGDHPRILACLTEDVEWHIPGAFHVQGKAAFDEKIESDQFQGHPEIEVERLIEEGEAVIAEGIVRAQRVDGTWLILAMCDVFDLRDGKIRRLVSYIMPMDDTSAVRTELAG